MFQKDGEQRLTVELRGGEATILLNFFGAVIELSVSLDRFSYHSCRNLSRDTDPAELLYAISDIDCAWGKWEDKWKEMLDACKESGEYLTDVRKRILDVLECEMIGRSMNYMVVAGKHSSKIQVHTPMGKHMVVEISNDNIEEDLKHIGYMFSHFSIGLTAMNREPKVTIGCESLSGSETRCQPGPPIEPTDFIDAANYIADMSCAIIHRQEDRLRELVSKANMVIDQKSLLRYVLELRGLNVTAFREDNQEAEVSVFFPIRLAHDNEADEDFVMFYPLACSAYSCRLTLDIEVPEEVVRDEWLKADGLLIEQINYQNGETHVTARFGENRQTGLIAVNYQGACIKQCVLMDEEGMTMSDVIEDATFCPLGITY